MTDTRLVCSVASNVVYIRLVVENKHLKNVPNERKRSYQRIWVKHSTDFFRGHWSADLENRKKNFGRSDSIVTN